MTFLKISELKYFISHPAARDDHQEPNDSLHRASEGNV